MPQLLLLILISIHAPTGGATGYNFYLNIGCTDFNPRSHGGSDLISCVRSILAFDFNPRSHGGSDAATEKKLKHLSIFQSTLPRGERLRRFTGMAPLHQISIHAPTGGATESGTGMLKIIKISIHAPTGGATKRRKNQKMVCRISIHAPTGGATGSYMGSRRWHIYFNPRSHGGSDFGWRSVFHYVTISIHAPTGGATSSGQ